MVVVSAGNDAKDHDTGSAEAHPDPGLVYVYFHNVNVANTDNGLQIALWWENSYNDLNLALYTPDGTEVAASAGSPGSDIGSNSDIVYEQISLSIPGRWQRCWVLAGQGDCLGRALQPARLSPLN